MMSQTLKPNNDMIVFILQSDEFLIQPIRKNVRELV